jgi:tetratricopeptide (TPR) repeat protein
MSKKTCTSIFNQSLSFNPWFFFFIFLISNTFLSFYPFTLQTQLFIVFFGLILPFSAGFKMVLDFKIHAQNDFGEDSFNPPVWLWVLVIFGVIFTRFYHLTTLPAWFYIDEGYESAMGMGLLTHWDWRLLWSPVPHEPLLDWLLGFYFKLVPPSFFSFRLFSTLISLATIGAAYWGTRSFLSRRGSLLFALILAFSYWSFTLSRLSIVVILIPLFQCISFGCLGHLIKAKKTSTRWWSWMGLVLCNIFGFYSWTNWAGLGLSIAFVLLLYYWRHPLIFKIYFFGFCVISAIGISPLILARLAPGAMSHIGAVYHFNPLKAFIYNWVGIFWDGSATFNFGSLWGGFLNPILDSLALLGALFFFQKKNTFWRLVFPIVIIISFFPALLAADDVELYRTLPILVFLTLAAAVGIQGLLKISSKKINFVLTILILFISVGIDVYNYASFYSNNHYLPDELQWRSNAYAQAYQMLDKLNQKSGPLYVFSQFTTDYDNRTLDVATYPFNVLQNPILNQVQPEWTAVMTNVNYIPFFVKTYPRTQITLLKKNSNVGNSSNYIALLIVPTSDVSSNVLSQWKEADSLFRKINLDLLNKNPITPWSDIANSFPPLPKNKRPDQLSVAIYWEKMGLFNFQGKNFKKAIDDYETAIQDGYPAAHLYYNLGVSLKSIGEDRKAEQAFQKALIPPC